jgi:hypothetical protein
MRVDNQGIALWYGTSDALAPAGAIEAPPQGDAAAATSAAPILVFTMTTPAEGMVVGRKVPASGAVRVQGAGPNRWPVYQVDSVEVTFGVDGQKVPAQIDKDRGSWSCTGTLPATAAGGSTVTLTATVSGTVTTKTGGTDADPTTHDDPFERHVSVSVVVDSTVPDLTIDSVVPLSVTVQPGETYVLDLSGTAGDADSKIDSVLLSIDAGAFTEVTEVIDRPDLGAGVKGWQQRGIALVPGLHNLTVRAVNGAGESRDATVRISVRLPFQPGEREQVFQPTRYLLDLGEFAHRYVKVNGSAGVVTPAVLAARFHQPFDRLTDREMYEQATASLPQARIAVEVLRAAAGAAADTAVDQRFRGLAYGAFLTALGTSYDELRLSRLADGAARQALAERVGIAIGPVGSERLDQLTSPPETIADAQLEKLTGFRSTAPGDPLRSPAGDATVLMWQRDSLRARWQQDDVLERDQPGQPRPIVDPDVIGEGHFHTRQLSDSAYAKWTARRTWIADTSAEIAQQLHQGADPLTRFDQAVTATVGAVDLPGLASRDADGADVRADLPMGLGLDAFRFLASCRSRLVDGVLLDTEWDDIADILVQVRKLRQYQPWRTEELSAGLILEPASFVLDDDGTGLPTGVPRWRADQAGYLAWRNTLAARSADAVNTETGYGQVIRPTEAVVLPQLRDALVSTMAAAGETPEDTVTRLTGELAIDLQAAGDQRTTRAEHALETLKGVLFSARSGRLDPDASGQAWTIDVAPAPGLDFDKEWNWMGDYSTWLSATRVFAYPENQLFPALYNGDPLLEQPSAAYNDLLTALRQEPRLAPEDARDKFAKTYLDKVRADAGLAAEFNLTDQLSDAGLVKHQQISRDKFGKPYQLEVFWLVPMAIAAKLQESGQFQAALDWYRTVYAYHLPPENRRIYHGLTLEGEPGVTSNYDKAPDWMINELNPHVFALQRRNCYTKATILAIAGCMHAFADAEFARNTSDGNARARTLYESAADLLDLPEAQPDTGDEVPYLPNPVWDALRQHGRSGLDKIHRGLNIAGVANPGTTQPSQYRYATLLERSKNVVAIAQQIEAAYLVALERRDDETYDALRARHDLEVAGATLVLNGLKLADAETGIRLAQLQRERAQIQYDHFDGLINGGLSDYETAALDGLLAAAALHAVAGSLSVFGVGVKTNPLDELADAVSTASQAAGMQASFERRKQEWELQRAVAGTDIEIGDQQIILATDQYLLAAQEKNLATLQLDHAAAVATFLATRFTNAELFEWMSGVLGRVYAFFLQQATALGQLAEAQLAFERQELPTGFVGSDYWRDASDGASAPDRRGLTGSARLLQDLYRLDQYAFETERRKLHLTQRFSLAQIAAVELQQFRQTGVLTFATPQELFDRDFPGHYLRLIKRVQLDMLALVPPDRGVRATLSASGISRTVVARESFDTVTLRRQPESIAFTSPTNASGLFTLEPESGLLLPFEGMGVDTTWRLELPKAANPLDYDTIADVLLTIEYTAVDSAAYRQQVIRRLDRRFNGDVSFSVRNQFPDSWYDLNNPDTVEPAQRMLVTLPVTPADLPTNIENLRVAQLTLFVLRADSLTDELTISSLSHEAAGQTTTSTPVTTVGGIVSTRRPTGEPWKLHLGSEPTGTWQLQLPDDPTVRTWLHDELIRDLIVVMSLTGTTPAWP